MSEVYFLDKLLDGVTVEWQELGDVAKYSDVRIDFNRVSKETYVGVDNLLQNRAGKTDSNYVPTEGRFIEYLPGDVLIGNIRPYLKKIWLANQAGGTNGDVLVIRPTQRSLSPGYLHQVLTDERFFAYNMQHAKGAKMPRGNKEKILEYKIPIPCPDDPKKSLEIQAEIVRILHAFTELTAELIAELTAELTARRKQYKYYRDRLLNFDERKVEWKTLSEIAFFQNAKPHEKLVSKDGDVALLTAGFISTEGRSARFVKEADVLTPALKSDVAMVMSDLPNGRALAKTFFVEESGRYAANQRVCLLRVKEPTLFAPKFLHYVMNRNGQLLAYDSGVDQTHLKKDWILNVRVPVPPLVEQVRIVAALDKFDTLARSISEGLPREIELRQKQCEKYRELLLSFPEPEEVAS
jgi:type I restriction enzyme, S subunit